MADGTKEAQNEQKFRVDDIAGDDRLLEGKVKELTGEKVLLAPNNVEVHDVDSVDWETACAVLLQIDGGAGAVYVHGNKLDIVMTGPGHGRGWSISQKTPREQSHIPCAVWCWNCFDQSCLRATQTLNWVR